MRSTSTGASDSMPSTAMPSATLPRRSATPGRCGASSAARARTASVISSSRQGGAHRPPVADLQAALVRDREPADLLHRVAEQLHAQRVLLGGREHVEDAAAHRELAPPLDQVGADVRRGDQPLDDLLQRHLVAGLQADRLEVAEAGDERLQHCPHRCDDDRHRSAAGLVRIGRRVGQPAQDREPPPDGVAARAEALVRQGLPRGELHDLLGRQEAAQRAGQVLRLPPGGGDREHRSARTGRRCGSEQRQQRRGGAWGAGDVGGETRAGGAGPEVGDGWIAHERGENSGQAHVRTSLRPADPTPRRTSSSPRGGVRCSKLEGTSRRPRPR